MNKESDGYQSLNSQLSCFSIVRTKYDGPLHNLCITRRIHHYQLCISCILCFCNVFFFRVSNVNRFIEKKKWFHTKKVRSRRFLTETNPNADYADDLACSEIDLLKINLYCIACSRQPGSLASTLTQIKQSSCVFKQDATVSTLNGKPLKEVDYFIYLGCNISSTQIDVNI